MAGCEERRNTALLGRFRQLDSGAIAAKPDVAEDEMHDLAFENAKGFLEVVNRRDDLIARFPEEIFIVECGQRLVLDDEYPLDDLLTLTEQHRNPVPWLRPRNNQRNERPGVECRARKVGAELRLLSHIKTPEGRSASPSSSLVPESRRGARSSA